MHDRRLIRSIFFRPPTIITAGLATAITAVLWGLATAAAAAQPPSSATSNETSATPTAVAVRFLTAWQHSDTARLAECLTPTARARFGAIGRAVVEHTRVDGFTIVESAQPTDETAVVALTWRTTFDMPAFATAIAEIERVRQAAIGADAERMAETLEIARHLIGRAGPARIQSAVERPAQRLLLSRIDAGPSWHVAEFLALPAASAGSSAVDSDGQGTPEATDEQPRPQPAQPADARDGFASATAAAEAFLAAAKEKNMEKLVRTLTPAQRRRVGEQYGLLFGHISVENYRVGEVKRVGAETVVEVKWKIKVDEDALLSKIVEMLLDMQKQMMPDFEPTDDDREMFKMLLQGMAADLRPKLEAENQQLKVAEVDGRWYVVGTTHDLPNLPGMGVPGDSDDQGRPANDEPPANEPAAETWGGSTPEALFRRVIEGWKTNNIDDLQWCMRPGNDRQAFRRASKVLILCLSVDSYQIAKVTLDGNTARIKFTWSARFDARKYAHMQLASMRESSEAQGVSAEQIDRMVRMYTPRVEQEARFWKGHIEKPEHTMTAIKHNNRWFVLQPFDPPDAPNGNG